MSFSVLHVVGARPNFVKSAPVIRALEEYGDCRQVVVHTGQHYDASMSDAILRDLDFPAPDYHLGIGSGSHAEQTGRTLIEFDRILNNEEVDVVVVCGDVNATLACALSAVKRRIPIAHVESGLRSNDWEMPEEINRVLTDRISDFLFTHSPEAEQNLRAEGIDPRRIHFVGNTMIDSLRLLERPAYERAAWRNAGVSEREYVLATLHRPSNVDSPHRLQAIARSFERLAQRHPVVFPIHPRTRVRLEEMGDLDRLVAAGVACLESVGYVDFLSLQLGAGAIVTDSGGVQEESSALGVPCFTLRRNTERPVTVSHGTNVLLGDHPSALEQVRLLEAARVPAAIPLWDGQAGKRIAAALMDADVIRAPEALSA